MSALCKAPSTQTIKPSLKQFIQMVNISRRLWSSTDSCHEALSFPSHERHDSGRRVNQDSSIAKVAFSVTLAAMNLLTEIYEKTFPFHLMSDDAADITCSCLFQFLHSAVTLLDRSSHFDSIFSFS